MRIAIATEVFVPKIDGVVTRVTRTVECLVAAGHEVLIFAPGDGPTSFAGCEVVRVPSIPFWPIYPEVRVTVPHPIVRRRLRTFDPDVVHVVNPTALGAVALRAAQGRYPVLASFHTHLEEYVSRLHLGALRPVARWWTRTLHHRAQVNLATSPQMADVLAGYGISGAGIWPKAVDTHTFHPGATSLQMRERLAGTSASVPLVIYVGRVSREKCLEDLLAVARLLPEVRFAVVGQGPALAEMREAASATVSFAGYLSGADLASAYASADLFYFPSTTETLGLAALESMASGVPVVAARAGGLPFVIHDGIDGALVTPRDPDEAAATISDLLAHPEVITTWSRAARQEAERHSWAEASASLVSAYQLAIRRAQGND